MHMIAGLLAGFPNFLLYFSVSIIFVLAFKFIYVKLTPYDEWHLIKEKQNTAAAIALSGAFLGYCLAISGAAKKLSQYRRFYGMGRCCNACSNYCICNCTLYFTSESGRAYRKR